MITRIRIKNYKSLADVDVALGPLTVLVGKNGSGKSNFVDALTFLSDCLDSPVDVALRNRGGIPGVWRRRPGRGRWPDLEFQFAWQSASVEVEYEFHLTAKGTGAFNIVSEQLLVQRAGKAPEGFQRRDNTVESVPGQTERETSSARLLADLLFPFGPIETLSLACRYAPDMREMRRPQPPNSLEGIALEPDASNAAAVLRRLRQQAADDPQERYQRICRLLGHIVPGLRTVKDRTAGGYDTLTFTQIVGEKDVEFNALNMSDGTLRMLAIMLAAYQDDWAALIAIEEPEANIHPGAADVLMDVLLDASERMQVLITTHSPDLLDYKRLSDEMILVAEMEEGITHVRPLGETSRRAIREALYTPGELLRMDELGTARDRPADYGEKLAEKYGVDEAGA